MSSGLHIKNKYFCLHFICPFGRALSDTAQAIQRCAVCPIYTAWAVCAGILLPWVSGTACPGSVCAGAFRVRWPVLRCWGWGRATPEGNRPKAGGGVVSSPIKFFKEKGVSKGRVANTHPTLQKRTCLIVQPVKNFPNEQKGPFCSAEYAIITI